MTAHHVDVPSINGNSIPLDLKSGTITVIIGANGSGKSRLGCLIDVALKDCHRIPAQKNLHFNDNTSPINLQAAISELLYGHRRHTSANKISRYGGDQKQMVTQLMSDYDKLLKVLFSEDYEIATKYRSESLVNPNIPAPETVLDKLSFIWEKVLIHRKLSVSSCQVEVSGIDGGEIYSATELSDCPAPYKGVQI